ncbi:MAG: MarR family transcriptional regulator [Kiritimatiellae bacterium]|nr:MarR family transcriptional regulator [Kiritimatiellia bacterium]
MSTKYPGNEQEQRALNAMICLMRASNAVQARLAARRASEGMTLTQLAVLEALLHVGPLCQRQLADKLLVTGANVTRVLDVLERDGWIRRTVRSGDRRYRTVELTVLGRKRIARVFPRHVRDVMEVFGGLSAAEQEALRVLCRKLGTDQPTGERA